MSCIASAPVDLYADINYGGQHLEAGPNNYPDLSKLGFDKALSSFKVKKGYGVTFYANTNYTGGTFQINASTGDMCIPDLRNYNGVNFNDMASSMKVVLLPTITVVCNASFPVDLYTDINYGGQNIGIGSAGNYPDLANAGFHNKSLSSFKVKKGYGVTFYANTNYTGGTFQINAVGSDICIPDLRNYNGVNFNDMASSVKVVSTSSSLDQTPISSNNILIWIIIILLILLVLYFLFIKK